MDIFKSIRKRFPQDQQVNVKNTMSYLTHLYNDTDDKGRHPFYKYQLKLMKQLLLYAIKIGHTTNIRFVSSMSDIYTKRIWKHFEKQGYKWARIEDSMEWLFLNLRY